MNITGLLIENLPDMVSAGTTAWATLFWEDDHFNKNVLHCAVDFGRIVSSADNNLSPALNCEKLVAYPVNETVFGTRAHSCKAYPENQNGHLFFKRGRLVADHTRLRLLDLEDEKYSRYFALAMIHNDGKPLEEEVVDAIDRVFAFVFGPHVKSDGHGLVARLKIMMRILNSRPYEQLKGDFAIVSPGSVFGTFVPVERGSKSGLFDADCVVTGSIPDHGVVELRDIDRVRCFIDLHRVRK